MKLTAPTKPMNKTFQNIVAVVTALSLVFLQVPILTFAQEARADAAADVAAQVEEAGSVDVSFTFDHSFITYDGQVVSPPASKVTLPAGSDLVFQAAADSGYVVDAVEATLNGATSTLSSDGAGEYTIPASAMLDGAASVYVHAVSAPEDEVADDGVTVVEEEAAAPEAADEPAADEAAEPEPAAEAADEAAAADERNDKEKFTYSDDSVKVTAKLSDPAVLPAGVEFVVTPVTAKSKGYNYEAYMEALNADSDKERTADNTLLYDVAFMNGDTEIALADGEASITFQFKDNQLTDDLHATEAADVEVIHLPLSDELKKEVDATADATDIKASDIVVEPVKAETTVKGDTQKTEFTTDGFSVYAMTVGTIAEADDSAITVHFDNVGGASGNGPTGSYQLFAYIDRNGSKYYALSDTLDLSSGEAVVMPDTFGQPYNSNTTTYTAGDAMQAYLVSGVDAEWKAQQIMNGQVDEWNWKQWASGSTVEDSWQLTITLPEKAGVIAVPAAARQTVSTTSEQQAATTAATTQSVEADSTDWDGGSSIDGLFSNSDDEPVATGSDTYDSILGDAVNFGVVTENFTLTGGDAETNVAAVNGICTVQTGNDLTNEVEQTFILANIKEQFKIKGFNAYVLTNEADAGKLVAMGNVSMIIDTSKSASELEATVRAMLNRASSQSALLASRADNAELTYGSDQKYHLDIAGKGAGTYYVTLDESTYNEAMGQADKLQIKKDANQTIVFNVKGNPSGIQKYSINNSATDSFTSKGDASSDMARTIVWNFINASGDISINAPIVGVMLAPNAKVTVNGTSAGWLVAKSVNIGSGEWHNVDQHVRVLRVGSSVALKAQKLIDGQASDISGFEFELFQKADGDWASLGTATNNLDSITFDALNYNADNFSSNGDSQDYIYKIVEKQGQTTVGGVTYNADKKAYYAKVTVNKVVKKSSNTESITYNASAPVYYSDEECTKPLEGLPAFNNTTEKQPETTDVSVTKAWADNDNAAGVRPQSVEVSLLANGKETGEKAMLSNDNNWSYTWSDLAVADDEGNAVAYTVSEPAVADGYTSAVSGDAATGFTVTNTYTYAAEGSFTLSGTKTLAGQAISDQNAAAFSYEILDEQGTQVARGTTNADGSIAYDQIKYYLNDGQNDVGEHTYTVREIIPSGSVQVESGLWKNGCYLYDGTNHTVVVNIADNGDGTLAASLVSVDGDEDKTTADFANAYEASGSVVISATKELVGQALEADQFSFQLKDEDGNVLQTVKNDVHGGIAFEAIEYTLDDVGEHAYTISEVNDEQPGIAYSTEIVNVKVLVEDDGSGKLTAIPSYPDSNATFVNTSATGSVTFQGEKTMTGRKLTAADSFSFTIAQVDEQGNVIKTLPAKATATGKSGTIVYPQIDYTRDDMRNDDGTYAQSKTFYYQVTEDVPADATITDDDGNAVAYANATDEQKAAGGFTKNGVTYASAPKTFEVVVTDDGNGTLNAEAKVAEDASEGENGSPAANASRSATGLFKTATNLNGNYDSTVRIKLEGEAAAEPEPQAEKKTYDLVFVVDCSQSQGDTASRLMNKMFDEAEKGGYNLNIGIVKYYYVAQVTRYLDGSAGWDEKSSKAGTNLPAGILLGTKLLDDDTSVADEDKYLVVLSDGDTYIYQQGNELNSYMKNNVLRTYGDNAMVVTQRDSDYLKVPFAGPGSYSWKYHNGNKEPDDFAAPDDWDAFFATVGAQVAADNGAYETKWDWHKDNQYSNATNAIPEDEINDHACSADTSLYYSLVNYRAAAQKYNTYAAYVYGGYDRPYGKSFMEYLNGGASFDLSKLEDALVDDLASGASQVEKGGVVDDTIGYGYDDKGNAYDMDFVNSIATTDIILNGKTLSKSVNDAGAFEFGKGSNGKPLFTLTYSGDTTPGKESYQVKFSDEVLATDTVEMRYNVHLANPQTKAGNYGNYAATGDPAGTVGLLVSSGATFSRGESVQDFAKPVVSYSALGFDNVYNAKGEVTFEGAKSLEGRVMTGGDTFEFEVLEGDAVVATGANDVTGAIAFSPIAYTLDDVGTHTYTVKETSEGGSEIEYDANAYMVTVDVSDTGNGTLKVAASGNASSLDFTNTIAPTSVSGKKTWEDNGNQDGMRPDKITVRLMNGDTEVASKEVTAKDNWSYTFDDLPVYENGERIVYTVAEDKVAGYDTTVNGYNITNSHTIETVGVPVKKVWDDADDQDGKRPSSVTVRLLADGEDTGKTVVLTQANDWQDSWTDLPKYSDGKEIAYTVAEDRVSGYDKPVVAGNASDGFTVTNARTAETVDIPVTKVWNDANDQDGMRPKSVEVSLKAQVDGKDITIKGVNTTQTLSADNGWKAKWTALPKYQAGKVVDYTVEEKRVKNYDEPVVTGSVEAGFTVTNTHTIEFTSVEAQKKWADADDQDGMRPTEITLQLNKNGKAYDTATVTAGTAWKHTWANLDKYEAGKEIAWTISEPTVPAGYTADVDGFTVTNTHEVGKTAITVTKAWSDANDQDGVRPESVTVNLLADGEKVDGKSVELSADNDWTYTWTDLDQKKAGKAIAYNVSEDEVGKGYTTAITGDAANGFTITNSRTTDTTEVSVAKKWNDANDQDGIRPASVTVQLYADGKAEGAAVTLSDANGWAYTWTNLAKNAKGKAVEYTVQETALDIDLPEGVTSGYTAKVAGSAAEGFTVTNTHRAETTSVSVSKSWQDNGDQDGKRAAGAKVQLQANTGEGGALENVGEPVAVGTDDTFNYTWTDLPKFKDGNAISYTVAELDVPEGYESVVATQAANSFSIVNKHNPGKTSISVTKVWNDKNDEAGLRPDSVDVQLLAGGEAADTVTLSQQNNWSYTWENLDEYVSGQKIEYTVAEAAQVARYDEPVVAGDAATGYTITNTYAPTYTQASVSKVWEDADDQDGARPASVQVNLYANGEVYRTVTLNEDNGWAASWTQLPTVIDGKDITYTVDEPNAVSGYEKAVANDGDAWTVTNTHETATTSVSIAKKWNDANDQDGLRTSATAQVQLMKTVGQDEPVAVRDPVTVGTDDEWTHVWDSLPKYEGGKLITYSIVEAGAPEGYVVNIQARNTTDGSFAFDVSNDYAPSKTSVTVNKAWADKDDADGLRPATVKVQLYADGAISGEPVELSQANGWTYTWTNLDQKADGQDIEYTVAEVGTVPGYTTGVVRNEGADSFSYTITNAHEVKYTTASVNKVWNDAGNRDALRPASIQVQLYANGAAYGDAVTLTEGAWSYEWAELPTIIGGQDVTYTIGEVAAPDKYASSVKRAGNSFTVTNSYEAEQTSVSAVKRWADSENQDGIRPASVDVQLQVDGAPVQIEGVNATTTLSADNNWSTTWSGLPKKAAGADIAYQVVELNVPQGYAVSYANDAEAGIVVTNTHETAKTSVSGTKTWNDANDQDGKRPESVTVRLLANDKEVASKAVRADGEGNWTYEFAELPKFADGKEIKYTVKEDAVEGYTAEINGFDVVNTHTPETTQVSGAKTWNDANDQDGKRPDSITVKLMNGETVVDTAEVTAEDDWAYSFTDLPAYANGQKIVYTIDEEAVAGYDKVVTGANLKNSYETETTEVSGVKVWEDEDNQDGLRPTSVTVNLLANGEKVNSAEVAADDSGNWTYRFTDLDKYANGEEIEYTVEEEPVEGYTTAIAGTTITNTHKPETTKRIVQKVWEDEDNQDGVRPASVQVTLLADGAEFKNVTLSDANNWQAVFTDLPVNKAGKPISYTLREDTKTEGYTVAIADAPLEAGFVVTNTHDVEKTSVSGVKAWVDADNQDNARPESIAVNLFANGEKAATKIVTADDGWKWTFDDLDKFAACKEIAYTVTEDAVEGYTTSISGFDATNTHETEKTSVRVTKSWNDASNYDGLRPASIQVRLYADGEPTDQVIALGEPNWSAEFTNLPKYAAGQVGHEIAYTVAEEGAVANYEMGEPEGTAAEGFTFTNTHEVEKVTVEGKKTWNDASNQDGKRPATIVVNLLANGKVAKSQEVKSDASGAWAYSFTDLDKYQNGKEIVYTVSEDAVADYDTTIEGYDITNSYTPEKTSISVSKTWEDADDQDGLRPDALKVTLLANGAKAANVDSEVALSEENGWSYTWSDLDRYANGEQITYTLQEEAVEGYELSGDGRALVNTHKPATVDVSGTKTWNDANDQDGIRPASVTVRLLADGEEVASQDVTAASGWAYRFTDLPKFKAGKQIAYTVTEDAVEGYTTTYAGYDVTNTHKPETVEIVGTKTWNDANNQDGLRKDVTVRLLADGVEVANTTVTAADGWAYSFGEQPKYKAGVEIEYTVVEDALEGYTATYEGYDVVNTHETATVDVSGTKTWNDNDDQDGIRPASITVNLLADGKKLADATVTPDEDGAWTYSFTDLPKFKAGAEIAYTVTEDAVDGYTAKVEGYDIANTHKTETVDVEGKKTWSDANNQDGKRPGSVTVHLYADGKDTGKSAVVNADTDWAYRFTGLDKNAGGSAITYTVVEDAVDDYSTTYDGYDVTNSYTPGKVAFSGIKVWSDADNQDGKRPTSVTVHLLADGQDTGKTAVASGATDWKYEFSDLDEYAAGKKIVYTVAEDEVAEYATEIDGGTITNTHTVETTSVEGTKTWVDNENQDGKRPESVKVRLLADGEEVASKDVTAADNWAYRFDNLPKYAAGQVGHEVAYTVAEDAVADYETSYDGFFITNTHEVEKTSVEGSKTWNDADNQDGKRPESITVRLFAGDDEVAAQTVTADNGWKWSFADLDKYAGGSEIAYRIAEDAVDGYTTSIEGFDAVNTHETEKVSVEGAKTWDDADNQDGKRPESVTVHLLANGVDTGKSATVGAAEDWKWSFADLDKYAGGAEITYTVSEDEVGVEGYQTKLDGMNVTNSYTPGKVSVSGVKVWEDANDQDGVRPDSVTVHLLANGEDTGQSAEVSAESNWQYTFADLDEYTGGNKIVYTVTEDAVDGYTTAIEGTTITNTHVTETTEATVSKTWADDDNRDGLRPAGVVLTLLADGEEAGTQTVVPDADGAWSYTFKNLPKYRNGGTEVAYTVVEEAVAGYEASVDGLAVTNTHDVTKTSVSGTKTWNDNDNQDGKRPESITVRLLADGEEVASQQVSAGEDGAWAYTFADLPANRDGGTAIAYTVTEDAVAGYTSAIDGYNVVNTLDVGDLIVSKTVRNASQAPASVFNFTVTLDDETINGDHGAMTFENGVAHVQLADGQSAVASGLPAGTGYTVTEEAAAGYTTTSTGETGAIEKGALAQASFTNTYAATGTLELAAMKNLEGRTLHAEEFSFQLAEGDTVIQTVKNAGDGHARFDAIEFDQGDVGVHNYRITEVPGDVQGVTYDTSVHEITATVTDNGDGTLAVTLDGYDPETGAVFTNTYAPAGEVQLTTTKRLDGKVPAEGAFEFQLVDSTGRVKATATNGEDGKVAFPKLSFNKAGTYEYTISEVLPEDAQQLGPNWISGNVAYDRGISKVSIEAIDNYDGTLEFKVVYDNSEKKVFQNTTVPEANFQLGATKVMEGRDFKAGDEFTFTVEGSDGAPMPANDTVTVKPAQGAQAAVDFGAISFTAEDLNKTYTYTMREVAPAADADAQGVTYDPFAHVVQVSIVDAGDGTLGVQAVYDNDADAQGVTFTNTYGATGTAQLFATKTLQGRALAADEFFFTLEGDGLDAALHAGADANGRAEFAPITYTQADAGKDFHYTITEDKGALPGITYDDAVREVTVHVEDAGDGTLNVTYDGADEYAGAAFTNTYTASSTSVVLFAKKLLAGAELAQGQFDFTLRGTSDNARGVQQTVANAADGTVAFDAIEYDAPGTYTYEIAEVVPAGATDNGDGTFTAGTVIYDGTAHAVRVVVADDGLGTLSAQVTYDGYSTLAITNGTRLASTGFSFDKYLFGSVEDAVFDFTLAAANADGTLRTGAALDTVAGAGVVDDGTSAFELRTQNGAFADGKAQVVFPAIEFAADGDYYYLASEDEDDTAAMVTDDAQYLVHVTVAGGKVTGTAYELIYQGQNLGATDDHSFYNNAAVTLGFSSLSAQGYTDEAERASVYPKAQKYLNGDTTQLLGGDYQFQLVDAESGTVIATATNDENGVVAFYDEEVDPGLVYDEPGTYRYLIREVAGDEAGVTYDDSQITLIVTVEQTDDGLTATTVYNGKGGAEPAFYNTKEGMDVTVQKVSRAGGEGLAGSTYALWMVGANGDVMVQEAVSDEKGYITFTDVDLMSGQLYYFKEVAAPAGHTVDPYRTAYFTLNEAGTALVLAEKTASDGWHAATEAE